MVRIPKLPQDITGTVNFRRDMSYGISHQHGVRWTELGTHDNTDIPAGIGKRPEQSSIDIDFDDIQVIGAVNENDEEGFVAGPRNGPGATKKKDAALRDN